MATQIAPTPLPETMRTLPLQKSKSPQPRVHAKWYPLTRLWTETITELRSEMDSTKWAHTASITFYLVLCCIWAVVMLFMCIYIPLMSMGYDDSGNHCAPDGSFRLEPTNLLAPAWFFQVVLGFGSLNFTAVKAVDIVWDVVSDFNDIESSRQLLTFEVGCGPCRTDTPGIYLMEDFLKVSLQRHDGCSCDIPDLLDSLHGRRPVSLVHPPHPQRLHLAQRSSIQASHVLHDPNDDIRSGLSNTCQCHDRLLRK